MGGSQGSERINKAIEAAWAVLIENFQIAHLTGKGKALRIGDHPRYRQFEFSENVHHLLAMADIVLSRAGASSIMEILIARKANILVPLGRQASRGEQIENARYFEAKGFSHVIPDEELSSQHLVAAIFTVIRRQAQYLAALEAAEIRDGTQAVCRVITEVVAEPQNVHKLV
jgi:UDP-N-acetylglucosamine--N-acetylmuramyl-(pentapeptide) pyrophosphoryl-undecaprenol N-acetylglucosamine transferase